MPQIGKPLFVTISCLSAFELERIQHFLKDHVKWLSSIFLKLFTHFCVLFDIRKFELSGNVIRQKFHI